MTESFLHGDSQRNYCVAIVVPDEKILKEIAQENNINGNFEELCKSKQMN